MPDFILPDTAIGARDVIRWWGTAACHAVLGDLDAYMVDGFACAPEESLVDFHALAAGGDFPLGFKGLVPRYDLFAHTPLAPKTMLSYEAEAADG